MRIAVFGLGEAGSAIAADLAAAGRQVHAYEPRDVPTPASVKRTATPQEAVTGAEVVCALTAGADADGALRQALSSIETGVVYADFATAAPGLKRDLGDTAAAAGLAFADVALMAPVPGNGLATPVLVSGPGAVRFADAFAPLGMPVEVCGAEPGAAATRKLLRSVVMKGLAAVLIESMQAAGAAGLARETWANLVEQFTVADERFLRRIVEGTYQHAHRRIDEMEATADLLNELGVAPLMTPATVESLRAVDRGAVPRVLSGI
jgi:3-hydroxyisobutyrate dehydrogenase-like beta-hydroxyacid dehydrogenase